MKAAFFISLGLVTVVATGVRLAPLIEGGDRLQRQCVSEDGYLMLTIARNIALGRGFSVSDGLIRTNGVQPLCALLYAACYVAVGADRIRGLYPVIALQLLISIITAGLLYWAVRRYWYRGPASETVAILAAVLWFASPTSIMHTQNSLETGLYVLLILASLLLYDVYRPLLATALRPGFCIGLGGLLGLTFLARNDACFLIAVLLGTHLFLAHRRGTLRRGFAQSLIVGATSIIAAAPWLWYNVLEFGHLVPVSGRAEALNIPFAQNFAPALVAMLENLLVVLRIPARLQEAYQVQVISAGVLVTLVVVAVRRRAWCARHFSVGVAALAGFVVVLFFYYSLFFGMPSFLGRYLCPVVLLASVVAAALTVTVARQPLAIGLRLGRIPVAVLAVAACVGLDARIYARGTQHLHFQVVEWVAANVPDDTWVAATQTGTLGYYHDRTINLDGKVDPHALTARAENRIPEYLIERNVRYIADWAGHAAWAAIPAFATNFDLIVHDRKRNLAVLRRRAQQRTADSS